MKIKKLLTVFVGVVLTLSLTGCGFSIGTSGDYSDVFTDPITSGKIHTMKSYQFVIMVQRQFMSIQQMVLLLS